MKNVSETADMMIALRLSVVARAPCSDLFKTAMYRYMKKCPKPYMHIVRANVDGDWEALVRTRPVGRWQETLALLATYTAQ
eukprot:scaffold185385_cov26-Tisochrysis_lutea.AAC.1